MIRQFPRWRLRLLGIVLACIVGILVYRILTIQIVRHDYYKDKSLDQSRFTAKWPATRGSIFDRNGSLLAATQRKYAVGVTPKDFPEDPQARAYLAKTLGISQRRVERCLADHDRKYVPLAADAELDEYNLKSLSSLPGIALDQVHDRINPLGSLPLRLIGEVNDEGKGTCGVEAAFEGLLRGSDGKVLVNRTATDKTFRLVNAPGERPADGCDIVLTIDSRIQEILDFELERAISKYGAIRGLAIVIDPFNGDILALSERIHPGSEDRIETSEMSGLFSVSCMYEPGSTFKLVTDSYLLERGSVEPLDVYYAENGCKEFDFGTICDDHPIEGWITFKQSFVKSSNICTIKAALGSDAQDFYKYILSCGFGTRTGIALPAESDGSLREPSVWSARSLPSISIGYEIGVTPLQMVMAYCALANGGDLIAPRIALRAIDTNGRIEKEFPSINIRRVFSRETARTMMDFCGDVVRVGTGTKAAVKGLDVAGKTGTSEKFIDGRYQDGKHITSFIGIAPKDDPEIVCLVLLDEPDANFRWGGESAAIVFSRIVSAVNISTDMLAEGATEMVSVDVERKRKVEVPNFLRLSHDRAIQLASEAGFTPYPPPGKGTVYAQTPDPGALVERGRKVYLLVRPDQDRSTDRVRVPELRGLSIREARRLLLGLGLDSSIRGTGIVKRQHPPAGAYVEKASTVCISCDLKCRIDYPKSIRLSNGATR
jgi:stage V sporulation protein D (sporulation-specific penicillin-binding protein)